jgi:nitrilase
LGKILAGPVFAKEAILWAELDTDDVSRGKFDFEVVGHYARPDMLKLTVDERPKQPVEQVSA